MKTVSSALVDTFQSCHSRFVAYQFIRSRMARASTSSKPAHSRKPYTNAASANGSSNGQVSISKLKSNLRQATRLLAKDKLDAQLRVETERRVESLKRELAEAEALRPKSESAKGANSIAAGATPQQPSSDKASTKGKGKAKKDDKPDRYKMLRHFEYQKTGRRCKKCRKEIQAIEEQMQATESGADDEAKAKKKQKKLRKELDRLKLELEMARIDAWYIEVSTVGNVSPVLTIELYADFNTSRRSPRTSNTSRYILQTAMWRSSFPPSRLPLLKQKIKQCPRYHLPRRSTKSVHTGEPWSKAVSKEKSYRESLSSRRWRRRRNSRQSQMQ